MASLPESQHRFSKASPDRVDGRLNTPKHHVGKLLLKKQRSCVRLSDANETVECLLLLVLLKCSWLLAIELVQRSLNATAEIEQKKVDLDLSLLGLNRLQVARLLGPESLLVMIEERAVDYSAVARRSDSTTASRAARALEEVRWRRSEREPLVAFLVVEEVELERTIL